MTLLGLVLVAKEGHASEWYAALFLASCVGYLWAQGRLIVPIIPFAIFYLLVAIDRVLQLALRSRPGLRHAALALVCGVVVLSALVSDARAIQSNLRYGLGKSVDMYYARDVEWSNYLQAMRWIAADAAAPPIVMCRKADLLYILTGYRALEYPYSADAAELRRAVYNSQVSYVIEDSFTWTRTTEQYLRPALEVWRREEPEAISLAYETDAPQTRVWRTAQ
jgi:hypothetical protein